PKWILVYLSAPELLLEQCLLLAEQHSSKVVIVTCDHMRDRI
ncbi:unnamed protein product, partial [Rotaria sp. Silwood2]